MDDILSIIGISSLVAAVVSVILGIIRDVFVERYRFRRQSQAGYIQSQIRLYSQIHFLLRSWKVTGEFATEAFGDPFENIRELNDIMKKSSDLLEARVIENWVALMKMTSIALKRKKYKKYAKQFTDQVNQLFSVIEEIMNDKLIPEYSKIVGETVPALE